MSINSMAVPPSKHVEYGYDNLNEYAYNLTHWFVHVFEGREDFVQHELTRFYSRGKTDDPHFYLCRFNEVNFKSIYNIYVDYFS